MPDNDELFNALRRPLIVSVDLLGYELRHPGDRLKLALDQPSVHWKISDEIGKHATRLIEPGFGSYYATGEPAKKIALNALQIAGQATWESIQKSHRYKLIESNLAGAKRSSKAVRVN